MHFKCLYGISHLLVCAATDKADTARRQQISGGFILLTDDLDISQRPLYTISFPAQTGIYKNTTKRLGESRVITSMLGQSMQS